MFGIATHFRHHAPVVATLAAFALTGGSADAANLNLLPIGDSITFGFVNNGNGANQNNGGWRPWLYEDLADEGLFVDFLGSQNDAPNAGLTGVTLPAGYVNNNRHEGHGGWRIDASQSLQQNSLNTGTNDFIATYNGSTIPDNSNFNNLNHGSRSYLASPEWMSNIAQADVIVLALGLNDVIRAEGLAGAPQRLADYADAIRTSSSFQPGTKIILPTLTPVATTSTIVDGEWPTSGTSTQKAAAVNAAIADFNGDLRNLFTNPAWNNDVVLADVYPAFFTQPGVVNGSFFQPGDGLHLTVAGNQAYAQVLANVIPEPGTATLLLAACGLLTLRPRRS